MKSLAERVLTGSGVSRLYRRLNRRTMAVLAYHNVLPDGVSRDGDVGLHIPRRRFARHLDRLRDTHRIVPLTEILRPDPGDGPPRAAITFDDAYRGALTVGLEELRSRGLPATVFVAPGLLGDRIFWWDRLGSWLERPPPDELREHVLTALEGRHDRFEEWAGPRGVAPAELPPPYRTVTEDELAAAATDPLLDVASHGWSHANLARLPREELATELSRSKKRLEEIAGRCVPFLAYPYGRTSEAVGRAALRRYRAAFVVDGGPVPCGSGLDGRRHELPRISVPGGASPANLELRTSGVLT